VITPNRQQFASRFGQFGGGIRANCGSGIAVERPLSKRAVGLRCCTHSCLRRQIPFKMDFVARADLHSCVV
jgi:hypothetical protein